MMKQLLHFLILFLHNEFFIQFGSAGPDEFALVLLQDGSTLDFARPSTLTIPKDGVFYYLAFYKKLVYFCPTDIAPNRILKIFDEINGQHDSPSKKLCVKPVQPVLIKVKGELQNDEGEQNIHLHHIGFLIDDTAGKRLTNIEKLADYESLTENHHFMPMISVYRDTKLQHTIAVKYKIIEADVQKNEENPQFEYYPDTFANKFEQLYQNQQSKLKEILGDHYVEDKHSLVLDTLVNENDMILDTWKKTAHFKVLQILVWKDKHEIWKKVREYLRHVAKYSDGIVTITAGIGNPLTITDGEEKKYEYKMEWGEGEGTTFIPELYWASIELNPIYSTVTTGIFLIVHNLPGAGEENVKKVCDTNACLDSEIWSITDAYEPFRGRLYCCPMDTSTIKKLGTAYLLTERNILQDSRQYKYNVPHY